MGIITIDGVAMPVEPLPPMPVSEVKPEDAPEPESPPVPSDSGTSVDTYA